MIRFLLLVAALSLSLGGAAAAAIAPADRAAIEAYEARLPAGPTAPPGAPPKALATRMAELKVPAVSVAFFENGKVKWARAYGVAAAGGGQAVTPQTLFQAASMSKALAAAAALRLVEQGRLDLDGDVNGRLRGWSVPASPCPSRPWRRRRRRWCGW